MVTIQNHMLRMNEKKIIFDIETQGLQAYRMRHTYHSDVYERILEEASRIMSEQMLNIKVAERLKRELAVEDHLYLQQIHSL